jgi:hypothetical protein
MGFGMRWHQKRSVAASSGKVTLTALACLINLAVRYACFFPLASLISFIFLSVFQVTQFNCRLLCFKKNKKWTAACVKFLLDLNLKKTNSIGPLKGPSPAGLPTREPLGPA